MSKVEPSSVIKRTLQIVAAPSGWFEVFYDEDGSASFDAIAFWALCQDAAGDTVVLAATPVDFNDGVPGVCCHTSNDRGSNLVGYMAPGDEKADWEARAKKKADEAASKRKK